MTITAVVACILTLIANRIAKTENGSLGILGQNKEKRIL